MRLIDYCDYYKRYVSKMKVVPAPKPHNVILFILYWGMEHELRWKSDTVLPSSQAYP
jgi:hypothetical protein